MLRRVYSLTLFMQVLSPVGSGSVFELADDVLWFRLYFVLKIRLVTGSIMLICCIVIITTGALCFVTFQSNQKNQQLLLVTVKYTYISKQHQS